MTLPTLKIFKLIFYFYNFKLNLIIIPELSKSALANTLF